MEFFEFIYVIYILAQTNIFVRLKCIWGKILFAKAGWIRFFVSNTVEPPVSNHPKCKD